jgi:amino acid adenylation domain-containing protein
MKYKINSKLTKQELFDNFWFHVRRIAEHYGDKPFVINKHGELSFKQNNNHANVICEEIKRSIKGKSIGVGLYMDNPLKIIPAMLGVMKSNNFFVPLDTTFPEETLQQILTIAEIKLILTDSDSIEKASSVLNDDGLLLINVDDLDYSLDIPEPEVHHSPDDIVQVLFTSGSTGEPKGAIEDYRYLVRAIALKMDSGDYDANDMVLQLSTFTYSAPHTHTFSALFSGATLYYHNLKEDGFFGLPDILRQQNITIFSATPTVFRGFIQILKPDEKFPNIKRVRGGGEKKLPKDIKDIQRHFPSVTKVQLGFASTETQIVSRNLVPVNYPFTEDAIPAGYPLEDIKLMIWDENGVELPVDVEGEIVIYGDALARGYINNPELTRKQFIPDPENPLCQYYRSGDLGKILPDGQLLHLGRIDQMVKIKGVRIELSTLENHILSYPGIVQVASKAINDGHGNKKLASYFVAENGINTPVSDLRKFLMERLPLTHLPHFLIQLAELPMTRNGKVALTKLPLPKMVRPELPYPKDPAVDDLEETLLGIWEEQLGVSGIGVNDDFFDLGGDSFLGVVLVVAIEKVLGSEFPVSVLLQAPTIRQQAKIIRNQEVDTTFSQLIPIHPHGSLPPLFFIPGKGGYPTRIRHLSKTLDADVPVYAMQDLMGQGKSDVESRQIKSTASLYLSEIKRIAPNGPYVLVGESMGGKICYEIAQQLRARGEELPLIFLLDTYNMEFSVKDQYHEQHNLPYYQMLLQKHLSIWFKSDWSGKKEYLQFYKETFGNKIKRFFGRKLTNATKKGRSKQPSLLPDNIKQMEREFIQADRNYITEPYPGKVVLIKALRGPYAFEPTNGWDKVDIGKLVVHQLDCYHGSILFEPAVTQLAEIIQKYIRELYQGIATITFDSLSKSYARYTNREVAALDDISFSIKENDFVSIVGPSGCGKTTLLKIIANLIKADSGNIFYEGYENPSAILVFQDQGVLPWMTVMENVELGLELKRIPKKQREMQAREFMKVVRLEGFEKYYPHELSGGMRQRVALARAFLTNPDLLLMDEPFGALDAQTRIVLQEELLGIWQEYPKTVLFVTHDIDEAILLSDRVIVMSDRPGIIQAKIDVPIPRPRDLKQKDDPRFLEIRWKIWNLLEKEVREDMILIQEKRTV